MFPFVTPEGALVTFTGEGGGVVVACPVFSSWVSTHPSQAREAKQGPAARATVEAVRLSEGSPGISWLGRA